MRALSEFASSDLEWVQPAMFRAEWELVAGSERLATMKRTLWYGGDLGGTTIEGSWIFRVAWFGDFKAYRRGESQPAAHGSAKSWRGIRTIELAGGRTLCWKRASLFPMIHELQTEAGLSLLRLHRRRAFLRHGATVEIAPSLRKDPELPLITLIGWCLLLHSVHHHGH